MIFSRGRQILWERIVSFLELKIQILLFKTCFRHENSTQHWLNSFLIYIHAYIYKTKKPKKTNQMQNNPAIILVQRTNFALWWNFIPWLHNIYYYFFFSENPKAICKPNTWKFNPFHWSVTTWNVLIYGNVAEVMKTATV